VDIQLKTTENRVLFTIDDILNNDDMEGIYLSTLEEMGSDYSMIAVIRDSMGECIGVARSLEGLSYVFNSVERSIEFQGEFYKANSSISIDP